MAHSTTPASVWELRNGGWSFADCQAGLGDASHCACQAVRCAIGAEEGSLIALAPMCHAFERKSASEGCNAGRGATGFLLMIRYPFWVQKMVPFSVSLPRASPELDFTPIMLHSCCFCVQAEKWRQTSLVSCGLGRVTNPAVFAVAQFLALLWRILVLSAVSDSFCVVT